MTAEPWKSQSTAAQAIRKPVKNRAASRRSCRTRSKGSITPERCARTSGVPEAGAVNRSAPSFTQGMADHITQVVQVVGLLDKSGNAFSREPLPDLLFGVPACNHGRQLRPDPPDFPEHFVPI